MRERCLRAKAARKFRATTDSEHRRPVAENHLNRQFSVSSPNQVWVGDITYLWTKEGWLYLAVFIDLYSRMVVGWSLGTRLSADLVLTAWRRACARRRPGEGLLVHTDRGVQYAAQDFSKALGGICAKLSMSRRGNCWDNAVAESFFHSFKVEAIHGVAFETRESMELEVFDYIERFYNRVRRHSSIGYRSPEQFERTNVEQRVAA
jgi:transposase InsO family protein